MIKKFVKVHIKMIPDQSPPYIKLVKRIAKRALVVGESDMYYEIAKDEIDALLGCISVPKIACESVS